ncbi:MAG TPA: hypothetical protein VKH65_09325, partial [Myxococcales bacterium]|nr:hypothetical protein [Myxococcales bacterium]
GEVLQAWTLRDHPRPFPPHIYVWPEYGNYVGAVPIVLLACGAVLALRDRERRIDLGVFALLVWCALGGIPGLSLFGVLHELPIFRSLRVPSRFLHPATVLGALLAVHALIRLRASLSRTRLAAAVPLAELVLAAAVAADLAITNGPRLQQGLGAPVPLAPASREFHQEASLDYRSLPFNPQRGLGTPICYGGFEWPVSRALWFGRAPQERIEPPDAGEVRELRWSPSAIDLEVSLRAPAVVVVNQNFEPGWAASEGMLASRAGLLALPLSPGTRTVRLRHRPEGFALGLALTLAGAVLCAAAVRGLTPQRVATLRSAVARRLRS